jgi:hypothetical protein
MTYGQTEEGVLVAFDGTQGEILAEDGSQVPMSVHTFQGTPCVGDRVVFIRGAMPGDFVRSAARHPSEPAGRARFRDEPVGFVAGPDSAEASSRFAPPYTGDPSLGDTVRVHRSNPPNPDPPRAPTRIERGPGPQPADPFRAPAEVRGTPTAAPGPQTVPPAAATTSRPAASGAAGAPPWQSMGADYGQLPERSLPVAHPGPTAPRPFAPPRGWGESLTVTVQHVAAVVGARGWPDQALVVGLVQARRPLGLGGRREKLRPLGPVAVLQRRLVGPMGRFDLARAGLPVPEATVRDWLATVDPGVRLLDEGYAIGADERVYAWRRPVSALEISAGPRLWPVRIRHVNGAAGRLTPVCDRHLDVQEIAEAAGDLLTVSTA